MTALLVPDADERGDLGAFVARVVRLDPAASARLRAGTSLGVDTVTAWASTPFDVLATRTVHGRVDPPDVTMPANALLTALAVERSATVDPGAGGVWPGDLPPESGWSPVDVVPAAEIDALTERGLAVARENAGPARAARVAAGPDRAHGERGGGPDGQGAAALPVRAVRDGLRRRRTTRCGSRPPGRGCAWTPATARSCAAAP